MSIQKALEQYGISKDEYKTLIAIREITKKGNSAEVKRRTDGGYNVYDVRKEKK